MVSTSFLIHTIHDMNCAKLYVLRGSIFSGIVVAVILNLGKLN
jgi:hypothetical protein